MSKLTHLEAFCSDDAKRGRVWTDGENFYRRTKDGAMQESSKGKPKSYWYNCLVQVAAMEGTVTWADEPKLLTPQEMVDAIGDIIGDNGCDCDCECENPRWECVCEDVEPCLACRIGDVIQPQFARAKPSQPAEQHEHIYQARHTKTAEPQVDYPLSYAEAYVAMHADGKTAARHDLELRYRYNSECGWFEAIDMSVAKDDWESFVLGSSFDKAAKWRIVDGGK